MKTKATKFYGAHGFTETTTGGNCTALERQHADLGVYVLLTAANDAMAPEHDDEPVTLGLYAMGNGEELGTISAENGEQAIKKLKAGEWQQVEAPTDEERFRR